MRKERNTQQESAIGRSWEEFEKDIYTADEITELIKQIHDNYYSNNSLNVKYKVLNKK